MTTKINFRNLCANIRYLRASNGLSRTVMAKKLGITTKTLDLLEAGVVPRRCTIRLLYNIYKNYGISVSDCFGTNLEEQNKP